MGQSCSCLLVLSQWAVGEFRTGSQKHMGVELREGLERWESVVHLLPDIQHNLTVSGLSLLGVVGM